MKTEIKESLCEHCGWSNDHSRDICLRNLLRVGDIEGIRRLKAVS